MKRIKLKPKKKHRKKSFLFVVFLLICFTTYFTIDFIGCVLGNKLMEYAKVEVERIARYVVNYSVSSNNVNQISTSEMFIVSKNKNDEIEVIDFDSAVVNKILNSITNNVISNFKAIEQGDLDVIDLSNGFLLNTNIDKLKQGIIAEIPIGLVTNNALLSNLGPKIPVKLSIAGDIESELETEIKYYGINNALVTVYVNIKVSEQIYMPIAVDRVTIEQKIPIAIKMIQGIVPNCYFGSLNSSLVNELIGNN